MSRDDLRRWVAGYRAAQRRERVEAAAAGPEASAAIRHALALIALGGRLDGPDAGDDAIERRDAQRARAAWARLRTVLLARGRSR